MLTDFDRRLLARYQRGFPLVPQPYAKIGAELGADEADVMEALARLQARGLLTRVGAVVRPNTVGASTLAAMSVPSDRLDQVADIVSAEPAVNHNYEREHALNLWFVVTGRDREAVAAALRRIEIATGLEAVELQLEAEYHIDLGFELA